MATRPGSATVTLPSDTEILITRTFEAPRALVWDCLTTPRHLLRWWGPSWCPMVACDVDLRVGGRWRYLCRDADGNELGWHGEYREIAPEERIVTTEVFEGFPDAESVNTMTLRDDGGHTVLQTLVRHSSREHRDGHVQSGMEAGMQETFDRLDVLVEAPQGAAARFALVADAFGDRVRQVPADAWSAPAPCEGWTALDVVDHLLTWVPAVLGRSGLDFSSVPPAADDPAAAWQAFRTVISTALADPEVAGHRFDAGPPGELTVERAVDMLVTGDVLLHTWDLARATGLDDQVDERLAAEMLVGMQPIDDVLRSSGHYGPKVEVPVGSSVQDRLVGFTGRDPSWSPAPAGSATTA